MHVYLRFFPIWNIVSASAFRKAFKTQGGLKLKNEATLFYSL